MALSSPSLVPQSPLKTPAPQTTGTPKPALPAPQLPENHSADEFSHSQKTKPEKNIKSKSAKSAVRFGDDDEHTHSTDNKKQRDWGKSLKNGIRKTGAWALGGASALGLVAIGIPLGLLQMAVGIVIHPLLITGMLTMGVPILGLIGSFLLGRTKK